MNWVNKSWLSEAIDQAKQGLSEGGLPIGSVLVDPQSGKVTHHLKLIFEYINSASVKKPGSVPRVQPEGSGW